MNQTRKTLQTLKSCYVFSPPPFKYLFQGVGFNSLTPPSAKLSRLYEVFAREMGNCLGSMLAEYSSVGGPVDSEDQALANP